MGILRKDTQGRYKAGSNELYIPSYDGMKIEHTNVVSSKSGRMQNGKMKIMWVRRDVRKVSLTYKYLTGSEVSYLDSILQGKEFTFTYYHKGKILTFSGYCGETSEEKLSDALYSSEGGLYANYSANIIEI